MPTIQHPEAASNRELATAVRARDRYASPIALTELIRRGEAKPALLTEVATTGEQPREARMKAIVALAVADGQRVRTTLTGLVDDPEPMVARRAIIGLAKVGREPELDRLEGARVADGPAADALRFAKALLGYRLRLDRHLLRVPPREELVVRPGVATVLPVTSARGSTVERALLEATSDLPAVPLAAETAVGLTCGETPHLVVLTEEGLAELREGTERPVLLAVVLKHTESAGRWFLHEYVFAHPNGAGAMALVGTRTSGTVVHAGSLLADGAVFALRPVRSPLRAATELAGAVGLGPSPVVRIEEAVSFFAEQRQQRTATKAGVDAI